MAGTRASTSNMIGGIQDRKPNSPECQTDHPISLKLAAVPGQQHEQWVPKDGSSIDGSGGSQGEIGLRSETLANGEVKCDREKSLEEAPAKQNKAQGEKTETRTEVGNNSQQSPNRTVRFPIPDHLVSLSSGQRKTSRTIVPRQHQHLVGVFQDSHLVIGGGSNR
jgi:hypothetical protein